MTLYMDVHIGLAAMSLPEAEDAHALDLAVEAKYGVHFIGGWVSDAGGQAFCLMEAPSPEAAAAVHREAHGMVADYILEISEAMVDGFLGGSPTTASGLRLLPDESRTDGATRTVLFTDMENSTKFTQEFGDDRYVDLLGVHDSVIRQALTTHGGREVKHTGDGVMASFVSASRAVESAMAIQRGFVEQGARPGASPIKVRIGLSTGEPVLVGASDLFGATVQLAARVCAHAKPRQILASSAVYDVCLGKNLPFQERGAVELRGFPEPIRVYEVAW
jgi:class 3 adenylate cyclase